MSLFANLMKFPKPVLLSCYCLCVVTACLFVGDVIAQEQGLPAPEASAPPQTDGISINPDNKKISIDYKDANLVTVLNALAYSCNLNLVITKDVKGKVSAHLKDITIDEALNAILSVNGYKFARKQDIIYVMRANDVDTIAQPFHLSFLMASDAKQILSKTISKQGDIQINEATNTLVIVDLPDNVEKVKRVLAEIDTAPIQVLIEAKVVDIQAKAFENIGTTINATYDPKGADMGGGLFGRSSLANESLAVATDMAGPSPDVAGNQLRITPTFKSLSIDANIDALIQHNRAHVLASPSIATLNGKEAKIIIGERFPYLETTQTASGNTQTTRFVDVGTALRVTPMVSPDGWITMRVHPEVSSVSESLSAGPRITTREADSTIRVRDNETIIIGGLINKKDDRVKAGVPVLRSIPVIGWLFSKRSLDREDTELTVFITPHIIRASSDAGHFQLTKAGLYSPDFVHKGDAYTQEQLFAYARSLEEAGEETKAQEPDLFRYSEMVQTYELIYKQFPDSPKADFCLYKIARIYNDIFRKNEAAIQTLHELIERFPDSVYRDEAEAMLRHLQRPSAMIADVTAIKTR